MLYSVNWSNFIVWLPLLLEILRKMWIEIACFKGCDVKYFKINMTNQAFFIYDQKSQDKNLRI